MTQRRPPPGGCRAQATSTYGGERWPCGFTRHQPAHVAALDGWGGH